MRDLRVDTRTFTEPIKIVSQKEIIQNGLVEYVDDIGGTFNYELEFAFSDDFSNDIVKVFANVMIAKDDYTLQNSVFNNKEVIKFTIRTPLAIKLIPQKTKIIVRNNIYLYQRMDSFGINTEKADLYAVKIGKE